MTTLAEYNNNPGNLKPPKGVTYEGQIGVDDKGFAIFEKKEFGQRALINDLKIKIDRGVNTPDKFVDAYDPPGGESDEAGRENYKIYLAQQLGLKSTKDPFPKDATEKLANAVSAFEGGTWYNTKQEEKKAPEAAPEAASDSSEPSADMDMGSVPLGAESPQEQAKLDAQQQSWDRLTAAAGTGAAGAGFGAVKVPTIKLLQRLNKVLPGTKVSVEDAAKLAEKVATGQIPTAPATTPAPGAPVAPGAPKSVIRVEPQGGSAVFNYGKAFGLTDIEAQRALDMTKGEGGVHDLTTQRRASTQKVGQLFPTETWRENPVYGGLVTTDPGVGRGPRASYVLGPDGPRQLPPTKPIPTAIPPMPEITIPPPQASPDAIQKGVRYVMGSSPMKWGLAGAGLGYNLEDAYQKFRDDQILGGLTSLGAAGASGLTLVPKYAARANPAAIGLTTASQVMGDLARGDRQSAAESGLTGSIMLAPRVMGPLGAIVYSGGLNKGEQEELERRRRLAPTITP